MIAIAKSIKWLQVTVDQAHVQNRIRVFFAHTLETNSKSGLYIAHMQRSQAWRKAHFPGSSANDEISKLMQQFSLYDSVSAHHLYLFSVAIFTLCI